jgi:hypothetical protein
MKFTSKYSISLLVLFVLLGIEVGLRLYGFGNPVLSQADNYTGYRFLPNQKVTRFGRYIEYNQYSQRSDPIALEHPKGKYRILMTGNSILNGGNPTNQNQTITELLKNKLSNGGHPAEVLDASAGAWGIENELGYIKEFGLFHSDLLILEIDTGNLTRKINKDKKYADPNFPYHRPLLAIQDALFRYVIPSIEKIISYKVQNTETSPRELDNQFKKNMRMLKDIISIAHSNGSSVAVIYIPNQNDLIPDFKIPKYKKDFLGILNSLNVPVIDAQTKWTDLSSSTIKSFYRDDLHLSVEGNKAVASLLYKNICVVNSALNICVAK